MYHSLIFQYGNTKVNTWDNWHLIPSSRPVVAQPTVNYKYVDIPGREAGPLDITEYLTGKPTYTTRKGSFDFIVVNNYGNWAARRTEIASFLNGRKMKLYLEDDPNYYYQGRFFFKDWKSGEKYSNVTIEYEVEPYRYKLDGGKAGL